LPKYDSNNNDNNDNLTIYSG